MSEISQTLPRSSKKDDEVPHDRDSEDSSKIRLATQDSFSVVSTESKSQGTVLRIRSELPDSFNKILNEYKPSQISLEELEQRPACAIKLFIDAVYLGELSGGNREGQGVIVYKSGRTYEGEWLSDQREGTGIEIDSKGNSYTGAFSSGRPNGNGIYAWKNGDTYDGQWSDGKRQGSGVWRNTKGDLYIGEWKDSKPDGYGVYIWRNGDRYEGEWKSCLKHGHGFEKFANGNTYSGDFVYGKTQGKGEFTWANGAKYIGEFKNGSKHGHGKLKKDMNDPKSDEYEGGFQGDVKSGEGVFRWENGNYYIGEFQDDLRNGFGEMYWIDGSWYVGQWLNGDQHGRGEFHRADGAVEKGFFFKNNYRGDIIPSLDSGLSATAKQGEGGQKNPKDAKHLRANLGSRLSGRLKHITKLETIDQKNAAHLNQTEEKRDTTPRSLRRIESSKLFGSESSRSSTPNLRIRRVESVHTIRASMASRMTNLKMSKAQLLNNLETLRGTDDTKTLGALQSWRKSLTPTGRDKRPKPKSRPQKLKLLAPNLVLEKDELAEKPRRIKKQPFQKASTKEESQPLGSARRNGSKSPLSIPSRKKVANPLNKTIATPTQKGFNTTNKVSQPIWESSVKPNSIDTLLPIREKKPRLKNQRFKPYADNSLKTSQTARSISPLTAGAGAETDRTITRSFIMTESLRGGGGSEKSHKSQIGSTSHGKRTLRRGNMKKTLGTMMTKPKTVTSSQILLPNPLRKLSRTVSEKEALSSIAKGEGQGFPFVEMVPNRVKTPKKSSSSASSTPKALKKERRTNSKLGDGDTAEPTIATAGRTTVIHIPNPTSEVFDSRAEESDQNDQKKHSEDLEEDNIVLSGTLGVQNQDALSALDNNVGSFDRSSTPVEGEESVGDAPGGSQSPDPVRRVIENVTSPTGSCYPHSKKQAQGVRGKGKKDTNLTSLKLQEERSKKLIQESAQDFREFQRAKEVASAEGTLRSGSSSLKDPGATSDAFTNRVVDEVLQIGSSSS